jgi:hypothetical protein
MNPYIILNAIADAKPYLLPFFAQVEKNWDQYFVNMIEKYILNEQLLPQNYQKVVYIKTNNYLSKKSTANLALIIKRH